MKAKHKLLPWGVYAILSTITAYALYPRPDDSVVLEQNLKIAEDILLNRDALLNKIAKELSSKDSKIVALIGAGGAGKSTLSRLYLKECQNKPGEIAFEINAETEETLYESLADMSRELVNETKQDGEEWARIQKSSNQNDKNKQIVKFVRRKLSESKRWLLVFDNMEELENILGIIPVTSRLYKKGKVLLTTRNQNIKATNLIKSKKLRCIDVGELSNQEKYKLFTLVLEKSTARKYDEKEIEKFLQNVPNYPLDVVSVACYLGSYSISLEEYQTEITKMREKLNRINEKLMSERTSYGKTRYGIVAITLNRILKDLNDQEVYKKLLLLISMCDSQNIPIKLLEKCSDSANTRLLLHELKKHSFIEFTKDSLSIHRSIQELWFFILNSKITDKSKQDLMRLITTNIIDIQELDIMHHKKNIIQMDRKWYQMLLPHINSIIARLELINYSQNARYIAYFSFASALFRQKRGDNIELVSSLYRKAIDIDRKHNVLSLYERASLLGEGGYLISSVDIAEGFSLIEEGLNIASDLENAEPLLAQISVDYGYLHIKRGEFNKGMRILNDALGYIPNGNELWMIRSYVQIKSMISRYVLFKNINDKKVVKECIEDMLDMLSRLGCSNLSKSKEKPKEVSNFVTTLNLILAIAYNASSEYENVENVYNEIEFIYNNFPETSAVRYYRIIGEYGISLLRKGDLLKAGKALYIALDSLVSLSVSKSDLIPVISCVSELNCRVGSFDKAIEVSQKTLTSSTTFKEAREKLCYTDCLYNVAFASYKLDKADDAKKYFGMFMKNIHELCGTLISESECKRLESEGAFSEQADVEAYLVNAYKIYAAIFGEDHAFVKDYVRKNVQGDVPALSSKMPVDKVEHPTAIGA